jgi:site-specific recombinase XerD
MRKHERFIEAHPEVEAWLRNRPESTRRNFARYLEQFCKAMNVKPEEWRRMDKFEARDLAWKYVEPKIIERSSIAAGTLMALKSWYRNLNGEQMPFDSGRGGKHYIKVKHTKLAREHIPNKAEMYQIIDMASSLRDKTLLILLFQSGVRVNVIEHLTYGDVADQLDEDIMTLKITEDLDHKLRGRDIPYYYTFLNGEGAETLTRYCKLKRKNSKPETPLFSTKGKKPITQRWVWEIVKMCSERAGFKPGTISTHTIRKAFRKIVRRADLDDDDKEQLMGHVIQGSREAYYDNKDVELIREAYQKCNFTREIPESNHVKMKNEIEQLRMEKTSLETRVDGLERTLQNLQEMVRQLREAEA